MGFLASPDILLAISLISEDGRFDQLYQSNYALIKLRDELARLEGIGDVLMGSAADKAGLGPGMQIVAVNGRQYAGPAAGDDRVLPALWLAPACELARPA